MADAEAVLAIYASGTAEGNATFETRVPTWEQFDAGHLAACSRVAVDESDTVLGWVAASPTSARCCYADVIAQRHGVWRDTLLIERRQKLP